ncbi:putative ATP-grasp subdomain 2 [Rosellinia necatrix]|uniref:Putative ATP-grasp subdomain 2 n=1 Tax=Rosellinia necatrix TaxID=77044 RepID=A0A1W2TUT6_ROSNE|nr:putative ATP-grasp subdomain 2 [Rosellinia necatrix]
MIGRVSQLGLRGKLSRHAGPAVAVAAPSRSYSRPPARRNYDSTLENLKIGSHTRVIFQGFTGKQATANAKESIEWGTNIVGGVRPGFEGEHLGLPVLPTVRKAMEVLKPDATGIYVAAHQATAAIREAIEAEIPLIVAVAEHIPLHDMIQIHAMLSSQTKSRLVGANSPGIISAVGRCRIGFQPLPCFKPGRAGIVARSGTLSYETAASTLRSALGQSMCIGVGGDILPGTSLKDGLRILAEDQDTDAIALVGEIGGEAEIEAADWIREYRARTDKPKPIAAIIGGIQAVPGRIMGHAGAFALPGEPSAQDKIQALRAAGCIIVTHPSRFGPVLKSALDGFARSDHDASSLLSGASFQRRGIHTVVRRPTPITTRDYTQHKRSIYITQSTASNLLRQRGLPVISNASSPETHRLLGVTLNRSTNRPCVIASPSADGDAKHLKRFDFDYMTRSEHLDISPIAAHLRLDGSDNVTTISLRAIVKGLVALFAEKEAYLLETRLAISGAGVAVASARLGFDDAAHRSGQRQADIQALRDTGADDAAEIEAEKDGIVYIKLPDGDGEGETANIGTLVNGAGLAMNTVDALAYAGGRAANFLDTGGKATSETVKKSFEIILTDPRVKCIFVNIFGGLTLGDMIARGVVLAFRDLRMSVPVVVRIRGTNEKEGQQIIAESGLPLFAFDDFDEAAKKAIELANAP